MSRITFHHIFRLIILGPLLSLIFPQCSDPDHKTLYFIGDSIIARWDLDEYFHAYPTVNLGISGSGIDYLESLNGHEQGRDVVVMIGTNNMSVDLDINEYTARYICALESLQARRIFLFSILPRDFNNENNLNHIIAEVNAEIQSQVSNIDNIQYIDTYNKFLEDGHLDYELYSDRLHLSPQGYETLTKALNRYL